MAVAAASSALYIAWTRRFPPPLLLASSSTTDSLPIRKRGLSRFFVSPHPWRRIHRISSQRLPTSSRNWAVGSLTEDLDVIPLRSGDPSYHDSAVDFDRERNWADESPSSSSSSTPVSTGPNAGGFGYRGDVGDFPSLPASHTPLVDVDSVGSGDDLDKLIDRSINATIVLTAGAFAITKLLTIDHDYWHGWTFFEILRYAPQHNWIAYEETLKTNPILAKMMISGVVYSLGDWIAQCYEGKLLFEFDRARMFRSGLVGFSLHGSLSHYYYHLCEALFPIEDWWVVPVKVAFDQTIWSAIWNSIYYIILGFLRFESPVSIYNELKATFWPMLTAGWKLWPFAHLITYGVIPLEQRLLWVDCVELLWVTILSTYSNEKSEARNSEFETDSTS